MKEKINGCIIHYNQRHIQLRDDYLAVCSTLLGEDGRSRDTPLVRCMALILRVLETLTDKQLRDRGQGSGEIRIPLSYEAIRLLIRSMFGRNVIREALDQLIQKGYVKRYQQRRTNIPLYVLCIEVLQEALDKLVFTSPEQEVSEMNMGFSEERPSSSEGRSSSSEERSSSSEGRSPSSEGRPPSSEGHNNIYTKIHPNITTTTTTKPSPVTSQKMQGENGSRRTDPAAEKMFAGKVVLSEEEQVVYERWRALWNGAPLEVTPAVKKACGELAPFDLSVENLRSIVSYARTNDRTGYYKRGVKLWDVAREYAGWLSTQMEPEPAFKRRNLSAEMQALRAEFEKPKTPEQEAKMREIAALIQEKRAQYHRKG